MSLGPRGVKGSEWSAQSNWYVSFRPVDVDRKDRGMALVANARFHFHHREGSHQD